MLSNNCCRKKYREASPLRISLFSLGFAAKFKLSLLFWREGGIILAGIFSYNEELKCGHKRGG